MENAEVHRMTSMTSMTSWRPSVAATIRCCCLISAPKTPPASNLLQLVDSTLMATNQHTAFIHYMFKFVIFHLVKI